MAAFMKLKAEDASKAIAHSQFQPETDGYMKLGDIKGEGVRNRIGIRNPMESAIKEVGWWTVDGADFRGIQQDALTKGGQEGEEAAINDAPPVFKSRSKWDAICDVGTAIKQPADLRTNGAVHQDTPMDTHPNDYITNIGQQGYSEVEWTYLKDGVGKNDIPQDFHPNQIADALLQQPSDTAGLINPDSMRPVDFANNQLRFETGLPVEGIGASNPMGIEPNQMMGSISPISRGDMFAAVSEFRSENCF